jgi:hypothetical protein
VTAPIAIGAPSESAAQLLVERLTRCRCWVVGTEADGWTVRAEPWRNDPISLREVLTTVESWAAETAAGAAKVTLDGRSYLLVAEDAAGAV